MKMNNQGYKPKRPKPYKTRSITVDDDVWEKSGIMLKAVGMSRSRFIEIILRQLSGVESNPFETVASKVVEDLLINMKVKVKE